MPLSAIIVESKPLIAEACDAILMAKGILLSTERDFTQLLAESGDTEALNQFFELRNVNAQLDKAYEIAPSDRAPGLIDSLKRRAADIEVDLIKRSKIYGDFTRNMAIGWKDVSNALDDRDVAIEFVTIPTTENKIVYAAYIIRRGIDTPAMQILFYEADLKAIPTDQRYTSSDLSQLLWGRLDDHLRNANRVFFAPAGELYNIAIESLPYYERGGLISDHHLLYRLSSTRQLAVVGAEQAEGRSGALFGGLNYNAGSRLPQSGETSVPRGGVAHLPATQKEVEAIGNMLHETNISAQMYTGDEGTEQAFKALSGNKLKIIHIATHGFYWTESEIRRAITPAMMMIGSRSAAHQHTDDKALNRSGIYLSGANRALSAQSSDIVDGTADGILTAKEVADMDLRGLDMVVLSACRTGLGAVTGDGVFGLQRGFKKAGANTILMSLWDVDDRATRMLMTRFYQKACAGYSKRKALLEAQSYVRDFCEPDPNRPDTMVRPYEHPRYWAAFILLDALD